MFDLRKGLTHSKCDNKSTICRIHTDGDGDGLKKTNIFFVVVMYLFHEYSFSR